MTHDEKNSGLSGELSPSDVNKEERVLGVMFDAAKPEGWDAAPGFEGRLEARLRDEIRAAATDPARLIWRAVPAAAAVAVIAVAVSMQTGLFETLGDYIVTSAVDPVVVEDLITLGIL